jgi:hypothetical protein
MSLFEKSQFCKLCGEYSYGPCECKTFYCTNTDPEEIENWENETEAKKINAKSSSAAAVKFFEWSDSDGVLFEGTRTVYVRLGLDGKVKRFDVDTWLDPSYEASEVVEWVAK